MALPELRKFEPERKLVRVPLVTSATFRRAMEPTVELPSPDEFAEQINIGEFAEPLPRLFKPSKTGMLYTEQESSELENAWGEETSDDPNYQARADEINARNRDLANAEVPLETVQVSCYDRENPQKLYTSPILIGKFNQVTPDLRALAMSGKFPMMAQQIHPWLSYPSPADYALLRMSIYDEEVRAVMGIVIARPEHQIMILPTSKTPGIERDGKKLEGWVKEWSDRYKGAEKDRLIIKAYEEEIQTIPERGLALWDMAIEREVERIADLVGLDEQGLLTPEQARQLDEDYERLSERNKIGYRHITDPNYLTAVRDYKAYKEYVRTRTHAELAEEMGVVAFKGNNMADFKKTTPEELLLAA